MVQDRTFSDRIVDVILFAILALLALACVTPFLNVISVSLSSFRAVSDHEVKLWPIEPHLQNFEYIIGDSAFLRTFANSTLRVAVGVSLSLLLMVITAYPLSRDKVHMPGRTAFNASSS